MLFTPTLFWKFFLRAIAFGIAKMLFDFVKWLFRKVVDLFEPAHSKPRPPLRYIRGRA